MKAGSRYRPTVAPGKTSCEAEPCYALPMQPGEKWSCPGRCQWMRCSYDDPPDVNCRAGYPTRRRTISLIAQRHFTRNPGRVPVGCEASDVVIFEGITLEAKARLRKKSLSSKLIGF